MAQLDHLTLKIDGQLIRVPQGLTVAAVLAYANDEYCRLSVTKQVRVPFCGIGVCQECRITIDGKRRLACQTLCAEDMQIWRE